MEEHPFDPIVFDDSRVLILGSFPSLKSFEEGFYYAHPRNQFWPLLSALFDEPATTRQERIGLCRKHRIALWDSAKSLARQSGNSSDTNLSDIVAHDFPAFLRQHPTIERILFTGRKAQHIFEKQKFALGIQTDLLPSPSPAYAAMPFAKKLERYRDLLGELCGTA